MKTGAEEHWRLRLVELIKHLQLSQRSFSDATGIDVSYVSRLLYIPGKKGRKNLGLTQMTTIRESFKLCPGWFDLPLGQDLPAKPGELVNAANEATDATNVIPVNSVIWPFKNTGYQRLQGLRIMLGTEKYAEAVADIDDQMDIVISKWEKKAIHNKRRSAS